MRPPPNRPWLTEEASARRFHDALQLHYLALSWEEIAARRWMAVQLGDGWSDNTAYESLAQAIASVRIADPNRYLYPRIPPPPGPGVPDCDVMLWMGRKAYANGYRPAGSHSGAELIMPTRIEGLDDPYMLSPATAETHRW